jgi:DNA topoisomerase I
VTPHLRFSSDTETGFSRERRGRGFTFRNARKVAIRDPDQVQRIRSLAIPPAWTRVWICRDNRGHLQATGFDARGRKQYRYHALFREQQEAGKFARLPEFGQALPTIRRRVRAHLALPGLPREKLLAMIVRLLERTSIRVGNEEYARTNDSFGLTTMRNRHVRIDGHHIEFDFRGKSRKSHRIVLRDPRLAELLRECQDLPGYELFRYREEDGAVRSVDASDVNGYLKELSGRETTTKEFRTWAGSLCAADYLARTQDIVTKAKVKEAIVLASQRLGNTPAICRKSYVHPRVQDPATWNNRDWMKRRGRAVPGLRRDERLLMRLLA